MAATDRYLQQLMKAALALPGIALSTNLVAANTFDSEDVDVDFKQLRYSEQNDLMEVDASYLSVGVPIDEYNDLQFTLEYETMSGASPIFTSPGADNTVIQTTSGASITDQRTAGALRYRHVLDKGVISITPSGSTENDYTSRALTTAYEWDTNNKNTTYSLGFGVAQDTVGATNTDLDEDKKGMSVFGGVTQVLDTRSLLQVNLSLAKESGYLSDPYKLTLVDGSILQDKRPAERQQIAFLTRYIHYLGAADASVHLNYRYYRDDWSIDGHTFEMSWHQELPQEWLLSPSLRYYSQNKAFFYEPYFIQTRTDGIYSSDYRLASFGSILAGVKIEKTLNATTKFNLNLEYYKRDGELKLAGDYSIDPEPLTSSAFTLGIARTF